MASILRIIRQARLQSDTCPPSVRLLSERLSERLSSSRQADTESGHRRLWALPKDILVKLFSVVVLGCDNVTHFVSVSLCRDCFHWTGRAPARAVSRMVARVR